MKWNLKYSIALPENMVRAHFLVSLQKVKVQITELDPDTIEFRSLEHILLAKHPIGSISKGVIQLNKIQDDITGIKIILNPTPLRTFAILFPTLFIILMTLFGHWITGYSFTEIFKGIWSIYLSVLGGAYLIYLLIKQTVTKYFNRLVDEARAFI